MLLLLVTVLYCMQNPHCLDANPVIQWYHFPVTSVAASFVSIVSWSSIRNTMPEFDLTHVTSVGSVLHWSVHVTNI